jgi:hypothetical protein
MKKNIGILVVIILGVGLWYVLSNPEKNINTAQTNIEVISYQVCDENGNRYASDIEALESGLSFAEFGATYCPEYVEGRFDKTNDQGAVKEVSGDLKNLEGTSWIFGRNGMIAFNGGMYSASVGCNTINGVFNQNDMIISFDLGASTLKACPDLQGAEDNVKEMLRDTKGYNIVGDTIILRGDNFLFELLPVKIQY